MTRLNLKEERKNPLLVIPGVGKSIAKDLNILGIIKVSDLKRKNPQVLYNKLCRINEAYLDRCLLYVFRCAVYFASHENHHPELLKWWNWSDKNIKKFEKI